MSLTFSLLPNSRRAFCFLRSNAQIVESAALHHIKSMNAVTGWATQMLFKQKMGAMTDSMPSTEPKNPNSRQMRKDLEASRAERDAEQQSKKEGGKKLNMKDRWAKNKAANK